MRTPEPLVSVQIIQQLVRRQWKGPCDAPWLATHQSFKKQVINELLNKKWLNIPVLSDVPIPVNIKPALR